jgi:transposase
MINKRVDMIPKLTDQTREIITKFTKSRTLKASLVKRATIILRASEGKQDLEIAKEVGLHYNNVGIWRNRYLEKQALLKELEESNSKTLEATIEAILSDLPRSGKPAVFTADQITKIIALACTHPKDHGYEQSQWTLSLLAQEIVKSGIAEKISAKSVGRFLKYGGFKTP